MDYTIYPLFNGCFNIFFKSARSMENIHCFAFLLVDENNDMVLVDTGFDAQAIPGSNTSFTQGREHQIINAIEKLGFDPGAVDEVIMTHIHWDHTAGMQYFPRARFYVQANEFKGLLQLNPNEETYFNPSHWLPLLPNIKLIQESQEIKPGLKVIHSGGHTKGHQLVEVQTKSGTIHLVGDSPFNYDLLWAQIPPERWVRYREGVGKRFYWDKEVISAISAWLEGRGCGGPIEGETVPWPEIKKLGSRLVMAHDARLVNVKSIP